MKIITSIFTFFIFAQSLYGQLSFDVHAKGAANSTWLLNKNISDMGATQDYELAWDSSYGVAANAYFGMTGVGIEFLYNSQCGVYRSLLY
jgi:hypothetical protein